MIIMLDKYKIRWCLSNAKVDSLVKTFSKFKIEYIIARRAINSKNPADTATEVIIYNEL